MSFQLSMTSLLKPINTGIKKVRPNKRYDMNELVSMLEDCSMDEYTTLVKLANNLETGMPVSDRQIRSKITLYLWNISWDVKSSEYDGETGQKLAMVPLIEDKLRKALYAYNRDDIINGRMYFHQAAQNMIEYMKI